MNIVNAIWEKRNLGVNTLEITFDQNDSIETVEESLKKIKAEYIVLKVPTYLTNLLPLIQDNGYHYIEDMIHFVNYLSNIHRNPIQQRLYDSITVEPMSAVDMHVLFTEIRNGFFSSDRIYLDPYFNREASINRYINWIEDEEKQGTEFLKHVYKNDTVGFFALKEIGNGHYTSFLGGIYKLYRKGGIGAIIKAPEEVRNRNGKKLSTSVSTNNPAQIKAMALNGYIPENITHTFIKHF